MVHRYVNLHQDEDGVWIAECMDLPGCVSDGNTMREAFVNLSDAIEGYLDILDEDGVQRS